MNHLIRAIAFSSLLLMASSHAVAGDVARRFISFKDAEALALGNSHALRSQRHVVDAADDTAFAHEVKRLPQLSLGADTTVVSKIGAISIPALGVSQQVGEHLNWSVGPVINFVVWDTGQIMNKARSLRKVALAEENALDVDRRQVLLNARAAYIGVQLAKEQVRLVSDALGLARAQYAYVSDRKHAGTADLFDLTVAHQEMTDREKDLEQAAGELAVSKRDLLGALSLEEEMGSADAVEVEPIMSVLQVLLPKSGVGVDVASHPQVKELADKRASAELAAKSTIAKYYPEVKFRGSATYEYPNLGQSEVIGQSRAMFNLSVPILDWGMIAKEARSQRYQAKAADEQQRQALVDLARSVSDVRADIDTSKKLRVATTRAAQDAVAVAGLSFESYTTGRIIFLDVQRANVKALSAKVEQARVEAGLSLRIAKLLALAETEGEW